MNQYIGQCLWSLAIHHTTVIPYSHKRAILVTVSWCLSSLNEKKPVISSIACLWQPFAMM